MSVRIIRAFAVLERWHETINDLARKATGITGFRRFAYLAASRRGLSRHRIRGASFVVNRDIPDLARVSASGIRNWDHQISSLKIENERENRFPGRGRDGDRERERFQD